MCVLKPQKGTSNVPSYYYINKAYVWLLVCSKKTRARFENIKEIFSENGYVVGVYKFHHLIINSTKTGFGFIWEAPSKDAQLYVTTLIINHRPL